MNHFQALALLALRRLDGRVGGPAESWGHAGHGGATGNGTTALLVIPDRPALAAALRRAGNRVWLTLELLFGRDALEPKLDAADREALAALLDRPCFAQMAATPAPFREPVRRDLHAARKSGLTF